MNCANNWFSHLISISYWHSLNARQDQLNKRHAISLHLNTLSWYFSFPSFPLPPSLAIPKKCASAELWWSRKRLRINSLVIMFLLAVIYVCFRTCGKILMPRHAACCLCRPNVFLTLLRRLDVFNDFNECKGSYL